MKIAFVALIFAASAFAQSPSPNPTAACGPGNVSFKVKLDGNRQTQTPPDAGKARVYFIHESGGTGTVGYPTTKFGVDGAWVGANHANSFFSVSVDPGQHHVCVALQSSLVDSRVELAHFRAVAGETYFFRTRLVMSREVELLVLEPIDSDQGKYLIDLFSLSVSRPKK
jgi:hypothetical protein